MKARLPVPFREERTMLPGYQTETWDEGGAEASKTFVSSSCLGFPDSSVADLGPVGRKKPR